MEFHTFKYSSKEAVREFLLSLNLTGSMELSDEKKLALLYGLSNRTGSHYTKTRIPKKDGSFRVLYAPDPVLKYVQRQLLKNVLASMPVSPCALAYRKKIGLSANASPHCGHRYVMKLDIADFFGSITFLQVYQKAFPEHLFPPALRTLLTNLCCLNDFLPQGAPTSPYISNLVLKPFDDYMERWCGEREISYTRYCDDMTFSGDFSPRQVYKKVRGFLLCMGFELNPEKTRVLGRGSRQLVTGIVVNEKPQITKEYRRRIRQEFYYIEKFGLKEHLKAIHYQKSPQEFLASLNGRIGRVLQVNPQDSYFQNLKTRLRTLS